VTEVTRQLLDHIQGNRECRESLAVVADHLIERGTPQGELITLALSGRSDSPDAKELQQAVLTTALGAAAPGALVTHWRHGFLRHVILNAHRCDLVGLDPPTALQKVLDDACGALLEELSIEFGTALDHQDAANRCLEVLRRSSVATLERLSHYRESGGDLVLDVRVMNDVLRNAPIEQLRLIGGAHRHDRLWELALSDVRDLQVEGDPLLLAAVGAPGSNGLRSLDIRLDPRPHHQRRPTLRFMDRFISAEHLPELRRLGLRCWLTANHFCHEMLDRPLPPKLEQLDLPWLELDDRSIEQLARHQDRLVGIQLPRQNPGGPPR